MVNLGGSTLLSGTQGIDAHVDEERGPLVRLWTDLRGTSSGARSHQHLTATRSSSEPGACRGLDEVMADVRDIRFVKIDVEGHEDAALQGMKGILDRDSPALVFEQHFGEFAHGKSRVVELLRSYGYTEFHAIDRVPSTHNAEKLGKLWFSACSLVRGMRIEVRPLAEVPPAFYQMLIARKPFH